ncbi:MAG: 16S rRNA (guanine(527)-N(7))-methyltransferase RsmG, partial [Alphaproteobacteria bacterium]
KLNLFVSLLDEWQRTQNLVGPSAIHEIWIRHIADSAQLTALAPKARRWLDIGAGAGFPGIVIAMLLAGAPGSFVDLVESRAKRCAFLREAGRVTGVSVAVHCERLENMTPGLPVVPDAISARAVAPLGKLLGWIEPMLEKGATAYLHKGLDFEREWQSIRDQKRFDLIVHDSRVGSGVIAEIRASSAKHNSET